MRSTDIRPHLHDAKRLAAANTGTAPDIWQMARTSRARARRKMIAAKSMLSSQPGCSLEVKLLELLILRNRTDPDDEDAHRSILNQMEAAIEEDW